MRIPNYEESCASIPENVVIWSENNKIKPEEVFKKSDKKIDWKCFDCKHIYTQSASHKNRGCKCPYCAIPSKILCGNNNCEFCFNKSCASLLNINKIWSKNNILNPEQVFKNSGKKIIWNCIQCKHFYTKTPDDKTKSLCGCPYCANKKLCEENENCEICFNKSCASLPNNILIWSKNNKLNPERVFKNINMKIEWNCKDCNHLYLQSPAVKNTSLCSCPYCANKKLCETCDICFNKTCASLENNNLNWSKTNEKLSRSIFKFDHKDYEWNCFKCKHVYLQSPHNKNMMKQDCPYCANQKLCENKNCKTCFNKSCASLPNNVLIWSKNNILKPEQVFKYSGQKIEWHCLKCKNLYMQSADSKNGKNAGCTICKYKTENLIHEYLQFENINFIKEFKLKGCTKRYDFLLIDYNIIIECDGFTHFKEVIFFKNSNLKENQENDINKMRKAILQGYSFLRFFQEDVFFNKIDWKRLIKDNLFKRETQDIKYYANNVNLYDNHKFLIKN